MAIPQSGTLSSAFRKIIPRESLLYCVPNLGIGGCGCSCWWFCLYHEILIRLFKRPLCDLCLLSNAIGIIYHLMLLSSLCDLWQEGSNDRKQQSLMFAKNCQRHNSPNYIFKLIHFQCMCVFLFKSIHIKINGSLMEIKYRENGSPLGSSVAFANHRRHFLVLPRYPWMLFRTVCLCHPLVTPLCHKHTNSPHYSHQVWKCRPFRKAVWHCAAEVKCRKLASQSCTQRVVDRGKWIWCCTLSSLVRYGIKN